HRRKFAELYRRMERAKGTLNSYSGLLGKYSSRAKKVHRENNLMMARGEEPEFFSELLALIVKEKPDAVGFSIVYNSQIFYGAKLIKALSGNGVDCVAGGPAAARLGREGCRVLNDGKELLEYLTGRTESGNSCALDFSHYPEDDYLSKEMIYPMRSSQGCSHGACAFCTHHENVPYREIDLECIKKTILDNKIKNLFFIDDNIPAGRLSELADMLGPLNVRWWCQTRPTEDLLGLFPKLRGSGLVCISFGVESGNQRILDSMGKGTRVEDIREVLAESHGSGIRNIVFVMFGFPGEDAASFADTVDFLRENRENLDMVSAAVFGLQKGSRVYARPEDYGVFGICERETPLGETISYKVRAGLSEEQAHAMKEKVVKELRDMDRLPKIFCLLKEQSLFF
ncbi:MAG TPA: hypothetical protein DCR97_07080, partial [Deltaproteobacteria bacterium]|nr:hypothetical protein [Deltaproteobacteria bacterium]